MGNHKANSAPLLWKTWHQIMLRQWDNPLICTQCNLLSSLCSLQA